MKNSFLAASVLYLLALPGIVIMLLNSSNFPLPLIPILLTIFCIHIGLKLAPRVGFRSLIVTRLSGQRLAGWRSGLAYVGIGAITIGLLWVILARMLISVGLVRETMAFPESVPIVRSILTGGIHEELIYRWGGMSLGIFVLWSWLGDNSKKPVVHLYWLVLVLTAALFSLAHIPHIWQLGSSVLAPFGLLQLVLSFITGLILGWIFWKKGLEFAMATHGFGILAIWLFSSFR